MNFGLEKCRINTMEKGKWTQSMDFGENENAGAIKGMNQDELYKYLGYHQARGIDHGRAKRELTEEYFTRLRRLLRAQLSAKNLSRAVSAYATSVLIYSFGILKWTDTELKNIDIKTRTMFTKHRCHHPRSAVERFHLPRTNGGRGIPSAANANYKQIHSLRNYFLSKKDESGLHKGVVEMDKAHTPLHLADPHYDPSQRIRPRDRLIDAWKGKALHGKYPALIEQTHIDRAATLSWLTDSNIFPETEGFTCSIQDQVVATRYYRKHIMKTAGNETDKCRLCAERPETIDHLISGCTMLAGNQYTERHDNVAKILHLEIRRIFEDPHLEKVPYYKYEPPAVVDAENCKIYWNREIITDRTITNNRPDIVLTDKIKKTTYLIDVTIPLADNIKRKHSEKLEKYFALAEEVKALWTQESVKIIPVVIGATGEIPKKLFEALNQLNIRTNIYKEMQKAVILKTCSIVRKVLTQSSHTI